ncbi:hypothetical protein [Streptomyces sp. H27-D2]|uniref:hypothetical protein n=1 Tax=Streptomyces sp. H27-D2 TaxID=3046304 RepID=UPI002DBF7381|nr:hypothetical protein [Streptomyces sp. H27-D2]MEC4016010.1 hypothetical protein [Streptomyces sp. H27-D2]
MSDLLPRTIAALDVPAAEVEADVRLRRALLLESLREALPVSDPRLAAERHCWLDADPDTAYPLPGIPHPAGGSDV